MNRRYQIMGLSPVFIIIAANLIVLVATYVTPDAIYRLGLIPAVFTDQPWTIVTSLFVHASIWHFLGNMLTLYFFGGFLAGLVGWGRFLVVYFGGGILGNVMYLILGDPFSVAVGASGAIFALGGALAVMRPGVKVIVFPIPVPVPLWIAVIGGFAILSLLPFVAWQGHLGGLIFGLGAGYLFRRREIGGRLR